jgi:hypothetical protein
VVRVSFEGQQLTINPKTNRGLKVSANDFDHSNALENRLEPILSQIFNPASEQKFRRK